MTRSVYLAVISLTLTITSSIISTTSCSPLATTNLRALLDEDENSVIQDHGSALKDHLLESATTPRPKSQTDAQLSNSIGVTNFILNPKNPEGSQPSSSSLTCHPDSCGCSDDFHPICGSDMVTYGNKCLFECNKKCEPSIVQNHEGYCGRIFFRDRKTGKVQDPTVRT